MSRSIEQPRPRRASEEGYNLVVMVIVITAFNVMVASAWPLWSAFAQRQKEEELIFRGLQYAEAIRVFQKRFGRYPNKLDELVKVEPRSIRQLWDDPMSEDGEWGVIYGNATTKGAKNSRHAGERRSVMSEVLKERRAEANKGKPADPGSTVPPGGASGPGLPGSGGNQPTTGPITGVFSKSDESGFKTFFGQSSYREWKFTADLVSQPPMGPTGVRTPHIGPRTLGKPFRGDISAPGGGQPGQGSLPRSGSAPGQRGGGKGRSATPNMPSGPGG